jgi:hypothetical protein
MAIKKILKAIFDYLLKTGLFYVVLMSGIASVLLQWWGLVLVESWESLRVLLASYLCLAIAGFSLWYREHSARNEESQRDFENQQSLKNQIRELQDRFTKQADQAKDKEEKLSRIQKQFEGLELEEKEIVRQLLVKERLGLQEIHQVSEQKCLPFVDGNRLKLKTDFLLWDAEARSFSIDPAYRDGLEEILRPPIPRASAYSEIEQTIPDLLSVLRQRFTENPLIRDIIVLNKKTIAYTWPDDHLFFSADDYPGIWSKIRILENQGLVFEVKDRFAYRMTEELATYLSRHL